MKKVNLYTVSKNNLYGHRKGSAIGTTEFIMVMAWDYDSVVSKLELIRAYDEAKERELFEAWYGGERIPSMDGNNRFMHDQDGVYWFVGTRKAWTGWQACAKSRARSAE